MLNQQMLNFHSGWFHEKCSVHYSSTRARRLYIDKLRNGRRKVPRKLYTKYSEKTSVQSSFLIMKSKFFGGTNSLPNRSIPLAGSRNSTL